MAKVQLDLKIDTSAATPEVKALVQSLEALAAASKKVSKPNANPAPPPPPAPPSDSLNVWERFSKLLAGDAETAARLKQNIGGVASVVQDVASKGIGATGFAGPLAGLVGVTSIAAVLGVVAGVVGMSLKMAYEFEKSSARAGAALSIGFGGSLQANMQRVQAASYQGEKYGYNVQEMVQAMETYGRSSGATVAQATAAAGDIATYSRAFGLDPGQTAAMVGSFQAASGDRGDFRSNANDLFGGAEQAGPLGRRIDEFAATATGVLQSLEYDQAGSRIDPSRATGFTAAVAREGGIYATSGGVQATLQAGESLVEGGTSDIQKSALLMRAGLSEKDIVLGNVGQDGGNIRKVLAEIQKEYGDLHGTLGSEALVSILGQGQARMIEGLKDPLRDFGMPQTRAETAREAKARADEFASTPAGMIVHEMTKLSNTMTADGEKLLQLGKKLLDETDALGKLQHAVEALDKDFSDFVHWWQQPGQTPTADQAAGATDVGGMTSNSSALPAFKDTWNPGADRDKNAAYWAAVRKGVHPRVAAAWALAGSNPQDAEDAVIMTAITKQETGSQEGKNEMNLDHSGAAGVYQMMPSTADQYAPADWIKKHGRIWGSNAHDDPEGKVQGPGFAAWFGSPNIQRVTALNYEHELGKEAYAKGYRGDDFVRAVMQGYYSGSVDLSVNHDGGTYGGTHYESSSQYANEGVATTHEMEYEGHLIKITVMPRFKPSGHKKPVAPRAHPHASTKPSPAASHRQGG